MELVHRPRRTLPTRVPTETAITARCLERATYTVGTTSTTVRHTAYQHDDAAPYREVEGMLRCPFTVWVPESAGGPSFASTNNDIIWTIDGSPRGSQGDLRNNRFVVTVAARISEHRRRVDD